jgi:hypothetical protein
LLFLSDPREHVVKERRQPGELHHNWGVGLTCFVGPNLEAPPDDPVISIYPNAKLDPNEFATRCNQSHSN